MKNVNKRYLKIALFLVAVILIFIFILPISVPLVAALITALVLNPLVKLAVNKFKFSRKIAVLIVFLLFLLIMSTIGTYLVMKTVTQVIHFAENVPTYIIQVNNQLLQWESEIQHFTEPLPDELIEEVTGQFHSTLLALNNNLTELFRIERIASAISKIPDYLVSLLVYLISLFLFMIELPKLKAGVYNLMHEKTAEKVTFMNKRLTDVIFGFFKAQFLVSIIIFIVSLIGLLIIIPQYALVMSLVIWVIDLIPILGSIIILAPWAVYMFIVGDYVLGIQLSILAVILLAIRRTVEPKVMGKHIGLSPLATLISMYIGLKLFGLIGFIIGPICVILFTSAKEAGIIKWNLKI
ncbi:sporulation integral membrane protein YtvI [Gracilibacillus halotolerans]|uniref:Sporulation integral membrane protein YtvI n=1 Tax=Gracilibacillus halotolerans TaxID=74386 RepID=A0A841RBQ5_9BACI|nr:sporulation integral membrane protein YtvI [Gracilibacillus halotolerans]MBB6511330.1 sporulation integral membrane protein YtvI [Gracilibacillus halotolerans]